MSHIISTALTKLKEKTFLWPSVAFWVLVWKISRSCWSSWMWVIVLLMLLTVFWMACCVLFTAVPTAVWTVLTALSTAAWVLLTASVTALETALETSPPELSPSARRVACVPFTVGREIAPASTSPCTPPAVDNKTIALLEKKLKSRKNAREARA